MIKPKEYIGDGRAITGRNWSMEGIFLVTLWPPPDTFINIFQKQKQKNLLFKRKNIYIYIFIRVQYANVLKFHVSFMLPNGLISVWFFFFFIYWFLFLWEPELKVRLYDSWITYSGPLETWCVLWIKSFRKKNKLETRRSSHWFCFFFFLLRWWSGDVTKREYNTPWTLRSWKWREKKKEYWSIFSLAKKSN